MKLITEIKELRSEVAGWRDEGLSVGVVPTMGALHAGHMSLVQAGRGQNDRVITTIFVNPTQFGENEDFDNYPNTRAADEARLKAAGVDVLFAPARSEIYPEGFSTRVIVDGLTECLCGASRPGHFDGVTQVVCKLLNMADADRAYFGEKDWQQLTVVRRMVRDLNIVTQIVSVPTVRAPDGLALSSRNAYLSPEALAVAPRLAQALAEAAHDIRSGMAACGACAKAIEAVLEAGFAKVDYLECRTADGLETVEKADTPCRVFAAAHLETARLIDNWPV